MTLQCTFHFCFKLERNYSSLLHSAKPSPYSIDRYAPKFDLDIKIKPWERWQTDRRTDATKCIISRLYDASRSITHQQDYLIICSKNVFTINIKWWSFHTVGSRQTNRQLHWTNYLPAWRLTKKKSNPWFQVTWNSKNSFFAIWVC